MSKHEWVVFLHQLFSDIAKQILSAIRITTEDQDKKKTYTIKFCGVLPGMNWKKPV